MAVHFSFTAALWIYPGDEAWHFITVPKDISETIKTITAGPRRGFGSIRVNVTIGSYTWQTSVFPDSKSGCYFLPIKKEVRAQHSLVPGSNVQLSLELQDN
jgi:hypothetical protein